MNEPTAEQIETERERAHALLEALCFPCISVERPGMRHDEDCGMVSTALARVRIEALAAGRDGGLKLAEALCHSQDCGMGDEHCGCAFALTERIRALRGRT